MLQNYAVLYIKRLNKELGTPFFFLCSFKLFCSPSSNKTKECLWPGNFYCAGPGVIAGEKKIFNRGLLSET